MQPLIDGDILCYEVGFAAKVSWQNEGEAPWDYVAEMLDMRINNICSSVGATSPPIIYLTGTHNFRDQIATRKQYKERPGNKPWHYYNIKAYLKGKYDAYSQEGLEADDLMAIEQTRRERYFAEHPMELEFLRSVICTRDKDLRAVPGWHFGWEVHNQPQFGPECVEELGYIRLSNDRKSIKGTGLLFFYAQCILGDPTDTIMGIEEYGAVKTFEILNDCIDPIDAFNRVREAYRLVYGDRGDEYLLETGRLLWMTRELDENGSPVLWRFPNECVHCLS